jgi:signal transduction histidine kinase
MGMPRKILFLTGRESELGAAARLLASAKGFGGTPISICETHSTFVKQERRENIVCAVVNFDEDESLAAAVREKIRSKSVAFPLLIFSSNETDAALWSEENCGLIDVHDPSTITSRYFEKCVLAAVETYRLRRQSQKWLRSAELRMQLMGLMSHEMRVPLETLRFALKNLVGSNLSRPSEQIAVNCERTVSYLCEYVSNFIEAARFSKGAATVCEEEFCLYALLEEVTDLLWPHANIKNIALRLKPNFQKDRRIQGDRKRIRQILVNLIGNAIRYTDGGAVTITASLNTQMSFIIRDTGVGMSADQIRTVFYSSPEATVINAGGSHSSGLGIGVALCRKLLELMDGDITVRSKEGAGTVIRISMPYRDSCNTPKKSLMPSEIKELVT